MTSIQSFHVAQLLTSIKDHVFYISKESTIGHIRSFNEEELFEEGSLHRQAIKVNAQSSLAALTSPHFHLYYQGE